MKEKIKFIRSGWIIAIFAIAFTNVLLIGQNDTESDQTALSIISKIAIANAEGDDCSKPGSTYLDRKPKTGTRCYCYESSKWITPQTCETGGTGCTEIPECS